MIGFVFTNTIDSFLYHSDMIEPAQTLVLHFDSRSDHIMSCTYFTSVCQGDPCDDGRDLTDSECFVDGGVLRQLANVFHELFKDVKWFAVLRGCEIISNEAYVVYHWGFEVDCFWAGRFLYRRTDGKVQTAQACEVKKTTRTAAGLQVGRWVWPVTVVILKGSISAMTEVVVIVRNVLDPVDDSRPQIDEEHLTRMMFSRTLSVGKCVN